VRKRLILIVKTFFCKLLLIIKKRIFYSTRVEINILKTSLREFYFITRIINYGSNESEYRISFTCVVPTTTTLHEMDNFDGALKPNLSGVLLNARACVRDQNFLISLTSE